jgi:hypothetical protein
MKVTELPGTGLLPQLDDASADLHPPSDPADWLDLEYVPACRLIMSQAEIDKDPDRWKAERRQDPVTGQWRLTASEMAVALGLAPKAWKVSSPFALYHAKLSGIDLWDGNDRTDLGLYLEDLIAARFAATRDDLEVGSGGLYQSIEHPWLVATFDRIAYDIRWATPNLETYQPAGPVQLKSWARRSDFGPDGSSVMPVYLRVQLLVEMIVLGTGYAWEPVMDLPSGRTRVMELERDAEAERDIVSILRLGQEFAGMLDSGTEPEVDWSDSTAKTLQALYPIQEGTEARIPARLARRLIAAKAAKAAAEERIGQAQNEIRARAGQAQDIIAYDPITDSVRRVVRRTGGPRAGFSVAPLEWVEAMRAGPWGKPLK